MKKIAFLSVLLISALVVFVGCIQTNEDFTAEQVSRFLEKKQGYTLLSEIFVHNSAGIIFVGSFNDTKLNFFDDFVYRNIDDVSFSAVVSKDGKFFVIFLNDDLPEPKIITKSEINEVVIRNSLTTTKSKGTTIY